MASTYQELAAQTQDEIGHLMSLSEGDVLLVLSPAEYDAITNQAELIKRIGSQFIGVIKGEEIEKRNTIILDIKDQGPFEAKAMLPDYATSVNARVKNAIDSIIDVLPPNANLSKPEKLRYDFRFQLQGKDQKPTTKKIKLFLTDNFYLRPETRLTLEYGKELLSRVALRQFNISQEDRKRISEKPLFDIFLEHQDNTEFLRNWTIVVLASINSTSIMSADPKAWMDPKVIKMQRQQGELAAAEINSLIISGRSI